MSAKRPRKFRVHWPTKLDSRHTGTPAQEPCTPEISSKMDVLSILGRPYALILDVLEEVLSEGFVAIERLP